MKYFEDFRVGDKIVTRGRTITETDIVNFAALSGDWHPLHTNIEYAKRTQFGERIAHGMLVLTLASGLISPEHLLHMAFIAFYGMDEVRFTAPTRIGDTIHVELEVMDKQDKDEHSGVISFRESTKNQKGENVALSMIKLLIARH